MSLDASETGPAEDSRVRGRDLRIRPSVVSDLPFVIRLSERVFRVYGPYGKILGLAFLQQRVFTLMALEVGRRVGFAMMSPILEGLELTALAVLPARQGKGIGRALLREAIRWAGLHGATHMVLHTAEENAKAQNLFLSEGFMVDDRIEGYYPEGQTAVQLCRVLEDEEARGSI